MSGRISDKHPAIAVKPTVLCRSGVYEYTYQEMCDRGYTPKVVKPIYKEYRPKDVIRKSAPLFAFTVSSINHTRDETSPDNFRTQAIGVIGDKIWEKELPDGELALVGNLAFMTKDGWEFYKAGNVETSADYRSVCEPAPDGAEYDFVLKDIKSVNGVVLTARGRGGPQVRVCDSLNMYGGVTMAGKEGVLARIFGRSKDTSFKLSKVVLDGARTVDKLDPAGREKLVGDIMGHITKLSESDKRDLLVGAVKDALGHPVDAVAKEKEVARIIDGLYDVCVAEDEKKVDEALAGVQDAFPPKKKDGEGDGDGDEDDKKKKEDDKKTKDSAGDKSIAELFDSFEKRITDSIASLVDKAVEKSVKDALGLKDDNKKKDDGRSKDDGAGIDEMTREEGAFLLDSAFGGR